MTNQSIMTGIYRCSLRYWIGSDRSYDRYNRSLVNRIEDLLDPSFLMYWKLLLNENDMNKVGHPFTTPNAFISFLA